MWVQTFYVRCAMTKTEGAILGCLVGFSGEDNVSIDVLEEKDFSSSIARRAFKIIKEVSDAHDDGEVDIVLISDYLNRKAQQDSENGIERNEDDEINSLFFINLLELVPSAANFLIYVDEIKNARRSVKLKKILKTSLDEVNGNAGKNVKVIEKLEENIQGLYAGTGDYDHGSLINDVIDETEARCKNGIDMPTGFRAFDAVWGGFFKQDLHVIAADSGHFKTTLTINLLEKLLKDGKKVLWFDAELGAKKLMRHFISIYGGIETWRAKKGVMNEESWKVFIESSAKVADLPLIVLSDIYELGAMRVEILKHAPDIVVIDHLQAMDFPQSESFWTFHNGIKMLKRMTIQMDVAMVALSQVTRDKAEQRSMRPPTLQNLFGSAAIKQLADVITMLHWPYKDMINSGIFKENIDKNELKIYHMKMREDGNANASMVINAEKGRVFDVERKYKEKQVDAF